jgi:hypothetical protein
VVVEPGRLMTMMMDGLDDSHDFATFLSGCLLFSNGVSVLAWHGQVWYFGWGFQLRVFRFSLFLVSSVNENLELRQSDSLRNFLVKTVHNLISHDLKSVHGAKSNSSNMSLVARSFAHRLRAKARATSDQTFLHLRRHQHQYQCNQSQYITPNLHSKIYQLSAMPCEE